MDELLKGITSDTKIYFDMDGVIAKWNENATLEEVGAEGYFLGRELEENVYLLIRKLIDMGFNVSILTAVYSNGYAEREKREWANRCGLADVDIIFVPYGESKFDYIDTTRGTKILVDDFKKNLTEWRQNGGISIKFFNGINNRPRMTFDDTGVGHLVQDSWNGPAIDHRQSVKCMASVIMGQIMAQKIA